MIRFVNVHKWFHKLHVLNEVNLEVKAGEVVVVCGPSGSGKSTLIRTVNQLEAISSGEIWVNGHNVVDPKTNLNALRTEVGFVFQHFNLYPHLSVLDNITLSPIQVKKVNPAAARTLGEQLLERVGLAHKRDAFPAQLSGGQQQRVAIARALVYNPPVILLDEPLSNLDAKLREEARSWLRELIVTLGLSALCVTHDQTEAMAMSDRILLLKDGRIEQQGSPQDMYDNPASLFVADFMGNNNRLNGQISEVRDGRAKISGEGWSFWGSLRGDAQPGRAATAMIRLERVRVADGPGDNHIALPLVTSMFLGDR